MSGCGRGVWNRSGSDGMDRSYANGVGHGMNPAPELPQQLLLPPSELPDLSDELLKS